MDILFGQKFLKTKAVKVYSAAFVIPTLVIVTFAYGAESDIKFPALSAPLLGSIYLLWLDIRVTVPHLAKYALRLNPAS